MRVPSPAVFYFMPRMSSAEQSRTRHSLESVAKVGWALPDRYCETVDLLTPIAFAISVLLLPEVSISFLIFSVIIWSIESFMASFY